MSKTRKLLSVVLALVMLVSVFAVSANAYGYEDADATYTQAWALSEPVDNGDGTYTVEVSLTTNYATGAIQFVVTNTDNTVATLVDAEVGSAIPASYGATASFSNKSGKVMIIADTSADETITATAINGVVAVLTYEYSGEGSADIAIANNPKTATNVAGTLIAARMDNGDLVTGDMITGQTVTSTGETWTIGGATEAPTLAVIDGTIGVIDYDRAADTDYTGFIYGVETLNSEEILDVFEVVGDGEPEVIENIAGCSNGTGAVINVLDMDGNVVESYVLVVFGDIDGDGAITPDDASYAELHDAFEYTENDCAGEIEDPAVLLAGDVDGDGMVTPDDASYMELHDAFEYYENDASGEITQEIIIGLL